MYGILNGQAIHFKESIRKKNALNSLFQSVPDNFFHPLSAPGKTVYWECIERLFAITSRQLSFGVERDVLVEDLTYYFDSQMSAEIEDDADTSSMTSRDKANFILRRLEAYGWISVEVDYSYVQRVSFRDYAVTVIKALEEVAGKQKTEYQGYIYTIYNLARADESPGIGLLQKEQIMNGRKKNLEDARILIYDSILMAVRVEDIRKVSGMIDQYRKGGQKTDEVTEETEAD